jgi:hypothetical protein
MEVSKMEKKIIAISSGILVLFGALIAWLNADMIMGYKHSYLMVYKQGAENTLLGAVETKSLESCMTEQMPKAEQEFAGQVDVVIECASRCQEHTGADKPVCKTYQSKKIEIKKEDFETNLNHIDVSQSNAIALAIELYKASFATATSEEKAQGYGKLNQFINSAVECKYERSNTPNDRGIFEREARCNLELNKNELNQYIKENNLWSIPIEEINQKIEQENKFAQGYVILYMGEGNYYFKPNRKKIFAELADFLTPDILEYERLVETETSASRLIHDGGIVVSYDDYVKRLKEYQDFMEKYPSSQYVQNVKDDYIRYAEFLVFGIDNSPICDSFKPKERVAALKAFAKNDAGLAPQINKMVKILEKNKYKCPKKFNPMGQRFNI